MHDETAQRSRRSETCGRIRQRRSFANTGIAAAFCVASSLIASACAGHSDPKACARRGDDSDQAGTSGELQSEAWAPEGNAGDRDTQKENPEAAGSDSAMETPDAGANTAIGVG